MSAAQSCRHARCAACCSRSRSVSSGSSASLIHDTSACFGCPSPRRAQRGRERAGRRHREQQERASAGRRPRRGGLRHAGQPRRIWPGRRCRRCRLGESRDSPRRARGGSPAASGGRADRGTARARPRARPTGHRLPAPAHSRPRPEGPQFLDVRHRRRQRNGVRPRRRRGRRAQPSTGNRPARRRVALSSAHRLRRPATLGRAARARPQAAAAGPPRERQQATPPEA